jgi:hypothetical protein
MATSRDGDGEHTAPRGSRRVADRIIALQRSVGNAAVGRLLREARWLAREPASADGDVITTAQQMLATDDRGPSSQIALLRMFAKGRVAAPQNHATLLAAGSAGHTFKFLPASGTPPATYGPYLSIGANFEERLARGEVDALAAELEVAIKQIDADRTPAPAAADPPPPMAPEEARIDLAATPDAWLSVVPKAFEDEVLTTDQQGSAIVLGHGWKDAAKASTGEPGALEDTAEEAKRKAKVDDVCAQIEAFRATLPGFQGKVPIKAGMAAGDKPGHMHTRFTERDLNAPPKATKKDPHPADSRTVQQKAAYESATEYAKWTNELKTGLGSKPTRPDPGASNAEKGAYRDAMIERLFMDVGGLEGGLDSINTYDSQILTWGGGLGGIGTPRALKSVADSKATAGGKVIGEEVSKILLRAGIWFAKGPPSNFDQFMVVDTAKRRVYQTVEMVTPAKKPGDPPKRSYKSNANQVIKSDPRLLMLLSHLSRGELPGMSPAARLVPHVAEGAAPAGGPVNAPGSDDAKVFKEALRLEVYQKQRDYFRNKHATGATSPEAAVEELGVKQGWSYDAICQVLHMQWGGVVVWSDFKHTNGDVKEIIKYAFTRYTSYVRTSPQATTEEEKKDNKRARIACCEPLITMVREHGLESSRAAWDTNEVDASQLEPGKYYLQKPAMTSNAGKPAATTTYRKLKD